MLILKSSENVHTKHCVIYTKSRSLSEINFTGVTNINNINASDLECDKIAVHFFGVDNITIGGMI